MRFLCIVFVFVLASCNKEKALLQKPLHNVQSQTINLDYAKTFTIEGKEGYYIVKVTEPWPNAKQTYTYIFFRKGIEIPSDLKADYKLEIPIKNIIVSSTTHIPPIESLVELKSIIGFPNTSYISSPTARSLIANGTIKDVGKSQSLNSELILNLQPDCLVSFAVKGENKAISTLQDANIPVLYNADWVEEHPLGKTEWIKFFGVLFDKVDEANTVFNTIKNEYEKAKTLAMTSAEKPTVISGALWKDQWYLPGGNSWQAMLMADANSNYLYADTKETGSLALSLESVLMKGKDAEYWISPSQFTSYSEMKNENSFYSQFKAFSSQRIFTYAKAKGETGGLVYYELASHRPDWVLKDLIHIFHPQALSEYESHFFKPLDP